MQIHWNLQFQTQHLNCKFEEWFSGFLSDMIANSTELNGNHWISMQNQIQHEFELQTSMEDLFEEFWRKEYWRILRWNRNWICLRCFNNINWGSAMSTYGRENENNDWILIFRFGENAPLSLFFLLFWNVVSWFPFCLKFCTIYNLCVLSCSLIRYPKLITFLHYYYSFCFVCVFFCFHFFFINRKCRSRVILDLSHFIYLYNVCTVICCSSFFSLVFLHVF